MTRWWWVRHGPTHQHSFTGWRDVAADLSDTGQVSRLRDMLPHDGAMISSDLRRAVETADALHQSHTRLPHAPDLREFNFGVWDGLHFSEVAEMHPELSRAYWERPGDVAPPEGESWNAAAARARKVVDQLNSDGYRDIVAVAHFGIILTQLQRASGKTAYDVLAQKIEPLSVTQLIFEDGVWSVGLVNHLP